MSLSPRILRRHRHSAILSAMWSMLPSCTSLNLSPKLGGYIILFFYSGISGGASHCSRACTIVISHRIHGNDYRNRPCWCFFYALAPPLPSFPDFCLFWWIVLYSTNKGNALRHSPLDSYLYCRKNSSWNLYPAGWLVLTLHPDLPVKHLLLQFLLFLLSPHRIPVVPVRICSVLLHHSNSE